MASRRQGRGKQAAGKKRARRGQAARRKPSRRGARSGARQTRPVAAARRVERDVASEAAASKMGEPVLRAVPAAHEELEPSPEVPSAFEAAVEEATIGGAGVPGFARLGAVRGDAAAQDVWRRLEGENGRATPKEGASGANGAEQLPGLSAIGIELALGALRLARTIATAPLRIGLAFLRSREA